MENRIRVIQNKMGSREKLEAFYGKSISDIKDEFRGVIKDKLLAQEMQRSITENVSVTPKEVHAYFNSILVDSIPFINMKLSFQQIVNYPQITKADKLIAYNNLAEIRNDIVVNGKSFETQARINSDDYGSAQLGGKIAGTKGMMVPQFEATVFKLRLNEVSEIIAETKAMVRNEYFKRKAEETSRRSQGEDDENPRGHDNNDYSKKDDMEEKEFKETMQQFLKLEQNLYDERNKEQILKACVQVFKDEEFSKRLNSNPYLLGCANGILELRKPVYDAQGKFVKFTTELRPGKPDDYVSFQMGMTEGDLPALEYYPYNLEDPMQEQVEDFFKKIFPNDELRIYMLTLMAGCLEGDDKEQAFYFLIGAGGNGKSKLMELMANVFGQYASTANTTLITRKKADAGAATPELACLRGARFIALQEPDENDVLNTARIKQLCGHDLVESRGLYKEQERFRIMGKWFMCSNRDPKVNSMDWGTWRRFKKIFFESSFVGEDKKNTVDHNKHIYLRDPDMDAALRKWRSAFFSLLVHYYETQYCPDGIKKIPEMVEKYTRAYRDSYDTFGKFVLSRVRTATVNDDRALGKRVDYRPFFASFKKWCDFNGLSRLSENEFKTRLLERFRPINENDASTKWAFENILLFESDEDAETFDKREEEESGFVDDA